MKTILNKIFLPALTIAMLGIAGCDKTKPYETVIPPAQVHFSSASTANIKVDDPSVNPAPVTIGIATTTVSKEARTATLNITSPNGLVAGREYTISATGNITFPAGGSTAEVVIQANASYFEPGVRDTLILTLGSTSPDFPVAEFNEKKIVVISGPCDDSDVDLAVMSGDFNNTVDDDGRYAVKVSGLTQTSETTGKGMIEGLWGAVAPADPVEINFDWTDPDNITVSIPLQGIGWNYAAGQPLLIRTSPGQISTFSVCNQTFSLVVDIIVNNYPGPGSAAYYDKDYPIEVGR